MKLYSGPLSLFTAKVRIALAEKGLACELIQVPFSRAQGYSPKLPEMLAINPKGQVPVLVDGDLEIYDSTIILEYLEDRWPEPHLYPTDAADKARCRVAEAAADEIFFPHVLTLITEVFYKPEEQRDAGRIAAAREALATQYARLDQKLAGREWLCGAFSVADIGYILAITFATGLGTAPPPLPNLGAWLARVSTRASVRAELDGLTRSMAAV